MTDVRTLLAVGPVHGEVEPLERLLAEPTSMAAIDTVAVVGDLGTAWSKTDTYRAIFRALGERDLPAFWVPGSIDAPIRDYLQESYNMEIVYPELRGIHGTFALDRSSLLFAGMGGEIADDPHTIRAEEALLRYPGWEAEYRLKGVRDFDELEKVFLFATPPAHKGLGEEGSTVVAGLIQTYRPRVAIVGVDEPKQELLGTTLVVSPGRADRGAYAVVDLPGRAAVPGNVFETARSEI
jgi:Icc-related predicted phosphoesterase